jgi:hypothetical protein
MMALLHYLTSIGHIVTIQQIQQSVPHFRKGQV